MVNLSLHTVARAQRSSAAFDLARNGLAGNRLAGTNSPGNRKRFGCWHGMPPENSIPLTFDEHRELGREMKVAADRLRSLCDLIVNVYGPNNRAAFSFLKAMEAMDRLNQDLQSQATQDLPGHPINDFYQ